MDNLDLIVHMYMYPTSFSAYADILLPTTEWLETNYTIPVCNTLICRQAVTHLYETMDESLIWSKLTKRLGELGHESCAKAFDAEYMGLDLPYWNTMEELLDRQAACVGMTWEDFKKVGMAETMPLDVWKHYYVYLDPDKKTGLPKGFRTGSKSARSTARASSSSPAPACRTAAQSCRRPARTTIPCPTTWSPVRARCGMMR